MSVDSGPDLCGARATPDVHAMHPRDMATLSFTPLSRDLCLSTHQMSVTHKSDGITTCSEHNRNTHACTSQKIITSETIFICKCIS